MSRRHVSLSSGSTWARSTSSSRSSARSVARGLQRSAEPDTRLAPLEGAHLPEVSRRPPRVRRRDAADARGRDRGARDAAEPARRARAADRRDRREEESPSTTFTRCSRRVPFADLRASARGVLDMLPALPLDEFAELRPRSSGTPRARARPRRRARTRDRDAGTIPDRGPFRRAPGAAGPRRRARRGDGLRDRRARCSSSAPHLAVEEITRDRVIVSPAPGVPARPFWRGEGVGPPVDSGCDRRVSRELV